MENVFPERGITVVELGKQYDALDESATRELEVKLRELSESINPPRLVLDMTQTEGIGSTFLAILFTTEKRLRARGGHLAVCNVNNFCGEVLEIVKADRVVRIAPTREAAVNEMLSPASASAN